MLGRFVSGWLGWKPSVAVQIFGPSLERGGGRSSELLFLVLRSTQGLVARARDCVWALDLRVVFLGSSELSFARASKVYVFEFLARASILSLERPAGLQT